MKTRVRKSPPKTPFSEPQERHPLANRPAPHAEQQMPWRSSLPPEFDYPELPPSSLQPGDVIRAVWYTTGYSHPGNAINCAGAWGPNTYVFEILRIEPNRSRWGGYTAACNYYRPGEESKAGVFLLAGASYEVVGWLGEQPEPVHVQAFVVQPSALPTNTDVALAEYEEP